MPLVLANRVQESATANTTVSFTLTGAVPGFQSFSVIGDTNTTYYSATDTTGNWEVGLGTYSTTGPTLTRTTIYASSNGGSAVTFVNPVTVFVTYPSGRSVNLNEGGNVSALGTVSSGVWQGSTIGVAYGGTGVTASSGANSVVLRDANQNIAVNRLNQANATTTAAGGTTALTAASSYSQTLVGTGNQTYTMPDASGLTTGLDFIFNNNATGTVTLRDYAGGLIGTITSGGAAELILLDNSTVAGIWDLHGFLPEGVTFGTNAFNLGSAVVSGGTWQGGTIQPAYGGTGLTTFTGANNALFSTGASTLTAGTLPSAAGGTGLTTFTGANNALFSTDASTLTAGTLPVAAGGTGTTTLTGYVKGNGTSAMTASASIPNSDTTATSANTANAIVARDASGNFSAGTITANLTGTASSATSATTSTNLAGGVGGAVPYQSGASTTGFSAAGTTGQVLTSAGTGAPTWTTATAANTASAIVQRDVSGNFSAGTITASLNGNASTATSASSATTATTATNLASGVAGAVPYQSGAGATAFSAAGTTGQVLTSAGTGAPTWTAATAANTSNAIVQRDASGNFSAGTITADLTGTASSATSATTSSNLAGGVAGAVPYQSGTGATAFSAAGTAGQVLTSTGTSAPSWTTATNSNTASAIVQRDASGNFSAGTITATLNGNATNVTGTVAIANGGTGQTTANAALNALLPSQTSNTGRYLTTDGTNTSWSAVGGGGASLSNDISTASNLFPLFANATSGTPATLFTSNAKLLYNPSTGDLQSSAVTASNGIVVNSATVTSSYTIPAGNNASSAGPLVVNSGVTVTVSSGGRWVVV